MNIIDSVLAGNTSYFWRETLHVFGGKFPLIIFTVLEGNPYYSPIVSCYNKTNIFSLAKPQYSSQLGFRSCTPPVRRNSSVIMAVNGKETTYGQLNTEDRLSDLPDSILHHIISFMGAQEACRTSILSKRWAHIWSTGLNLDFRPQFFVPKIDGDFVESSTGPYSDETIERLTNFIESTMQRFSEENLSIREFRLEYLSIDQEMTERIDRWVGIALRNQVKFLSLSVIQDELEDPPLYALPAILFSAKSLMAMKLCRVRLPYIEDAKLISLQCLELTKVDVDEHMLQDIIKSCPLIILSIDRCSGLQNISIPCCSRLEYLRVSETVPVGGTTITADTSSLRYFSYFGGQKVDPFPIILTPASKKNLRVLQIFCVYIIDEFFGKLVSELPSIEIMEFFGCTMPTNVKIASQMLKKLGIHGCYELVNLVIEAPNLDSFFYRGDLQHSSVINSHNKYNAYLHLTTSKLDTRALVGIKNFISKSKCCCKILSIIMRADAPKIEFDKDQLNKIDDGSPCDVKQLKLSIGRSSPILEKSSCEALIDGLLWCCRPDILFLSVSLDFHNIIIRTLLEILQKKVKNWKHPLKRMEIDGVNGSPFSWDFDLRLKLYW